VLQPDEIKEDYNNSDDVDEDVPSEQKLSYGTVELELSWHMDPEHSVCPANARRRTLSMDRARSASLVTQTDRQLRPSVAGLLTSYSLRFDMLAFV